MFREPPPPPIRHKAEGYAAATGCFAIRVINFSFTQRRSDVCQNGRKICLLILEVHHYPTLDHLQFLAMVLCSEPLQ